MKNLFLSHCKLTSLIIIAVSVVLYFIVSNEEPVNFDGKKVIIIGASAGIGEALARKFSSEGCIVGLTARRDHLLKEISESLPGKSHSIQMDVTQTEESRTKLTKLIETMGGMDLIILNAGVGIPNQELIWEDEKKMIGVNVVGFASLATLSMNYFTRRSEGYGHIVGISSVMSNRGSPIAPSYAASKSFITSFLEGLRMRASIITENKNDDNPNFNIFVTDVQPGFVLTDMTRQNKGMFWVSTPEVAASQIFDGVRTKKSTIYVTKRWRLVAWYMRLAPYWVYIKGLKNVFDE